MSVSSGDVVDLGRLTQKALARLARKTPRQLRRYLDDPEFPRHTDGTRTWYVWDEVAPWLERYARELAKREEGESATDAARRRKLEAEATSKELELEVRLERLIPIEDVASLVREELEVVDSILKGSPPRFAPELAKSAGVSLKVARRILDGTIERVRTALREDELKSA